MAKEICISTTPHETRLAILEDDQLAEIYYERENEYTLAGSVYKGRVTRVLPGMQSSFVDVGLERDAFLYVTDFLEDQEDSEEYETSSASGNGSGNAAGSPRRGGERQPADEAPAAPAAGERRGRGRRGEARKAERPTDQPEGAEPAARSRAGEERAAATAALRTAEPDEADREEKGDEEAPQGTRRWRGRRGRRRGGMRAGVLGASAAGPVSGDAQGDLPQTAAAPFALPEHGAPGGLAAPQGLVVQEDDAEPETLDLQASAAAPRREPGGGRRRGREERTDRTGRMDRVGRDPREAAPAAGGAIVLPGESLSKYGATPPAETGTKPEAKLALPSRPVNYTPPKPATQIEVLQGMEGWDGGSVLPGESLSRYSSPGKATASAPAGLDQSAAESDSRPAMAEDAPAAGQSHTEPALEAAPEAWPGSTADPVEAPHGSTAPPEIVAEALPGLAGPEQATNPIHPPQEAAEYEPEDGAASVRLSPPSKNELRLSRLFGGGDSPAPVAKGSLEAAPHQPDAPEAGAALEQPLPEQASSPEEPVRSTLEAGSETIPETVAEMNRELEASAHASGPSHARHEEAPDHSGPAPSAHAGSRHSEEPFAADVPEAEEPVSLHGAGETHRREDGFTELVDQLQGFAPGSGLLEEEVIDEDEYDFDPIDAHADEHDLEDLEEETLDGHAHHDYQADHETENETENEIENGAGHGAENQAGNRTENRSENENGAQLEQRDTRALRMHEDDEDDAAAFALEEVEEEEDEGEPMAAGAPQSPDRAGDRTGERTGDDRGRRGQRGDRGDRNVRRRGGPGRRQSAQTQDLPIISDLLKQGQEILVQIAKEPIAKKGARITSHIALPGRFLVFMPTVSHVGVSRKIESDGERQRLKRILISEKGESSGGFIVRTAAEGASEEELRADLRFLISLWTEIKQRADTAKAPSLLYHDLNLVERILRDQVSSNFSTIWVDTEQEYERIVRFLNRFQPSLVRRVKLYTKETPLFEHFGIQEEISKALKSKVWLKSGGSIVINQTEALVAIDINTGKYVGKTARLEDTIVKTNLDAIPEIVRQIRLRDLGGIIVIDFIDMDERKNRHRVLAALEEAMKVDRAPSKVLQFNDFGLVAITRKRVKQSLERTLSVTCETCAGTGMVKSPITVCNEIFIELRKMQKHLDGKDVMLRVNPEVVKQLKSGSGRWINEYEEVVGKTIIIKSDPSLHPEQFDIH